MDCNFSLQCLAFQSLIFEKYQILDIHETWSEQSGCAACAVLQTGCVANVVATINSGGPSEVRVLPLAVAGRT
jgi:hypothetical protein